MTSKAELRKVLLECAEFFKQELDFHTCEFMPDRVGKRLEEKFSELCGKTFDVLGNPTVADCDRIRSGVS